jgi:hypothetical protein
MHFSTRKMENIEGFCCAYKSLWWIAASLLKFVRQNSNCCRCRLKYNKYTTLSVTVPRIFGPLQSTSLQASTFYAAQILPLYRKKIGNIVSDDCIPLQYCCLWH